MAPAHQCSVLTLANNAGPIARPKHLVPQLVHSRPAYASPLVPGPPFPRTPSAHPLSTTSTIIRLCLSVLALAPNPKLKGPTCAAQPASLHAQSTSPPVHAHPPPSPPNRSAPPPTPGPSLCPLPVTLTRTKEISPDTA
ncbi:hypothetical protein LLEC1_03495 [Akanthomyces lecanii]|uniref:Uncharacterized protein n=1 Tax=Cordyceps confragosa TaxID=2714763 RepID=A0A179IKC1_CORDF|nr:hypothetical protein LLEC1_03495 [Akanthomyces lecanii]